MKKHPHHLLTDIPAVGKGLLILTCAISLAACDSKDSEGSLTTFETARVEQQISTFKQSPTEANLKSAELALKEMESEIKELEVKIGQMSGSDVAKAEGKLKTLKEQYNSYRGDLTKARVESTADKVGDSVENAAERVGDSIKNAADSVKDAVSN